MNILTATPQPFHGLFGRESTREGAVLTRRPDGPSVIPCPSTGRLLRVATIETNAKAICPSCMSHGSGGYVSFEQDLRMAYACPSCERFVWLAGA